MSGKAHIVGDHIDTDVIIPAGRLNDPRPEVLAKHCMENLEPNWVDRVSPGDVLVAGVNFGCGSSREHAPIAIKACGISAVIARNFARIFFRNSINIGLPIFECPEAVDATDEGDVISFDLSSGTITNETKNQTFQAEPFPEFMLNIVDAGGLVEYTKRKLQTQG